MKTYWLYLDDFRMPANSWHDSFDKDYLRDDWEIVRSYDEFVTRILSRLKKGAFPQVISFDHDLADEHYAPREHWDEKYTPWAESQNFKEKTGMDCAKWLVDLCLDRNLTLPQYKVHSANPAGAANIQLLLDGFKKFQQNNV